MSEKQDLSELLQKALDDIDEIGGSERHLLAQTIGKPTYDKLVSKPRTADLIDRWLSAGPKAKPAATKALSVAIARVADKPDLVRRIEREISDTFDEGGSGTLSAAQHLPKPRNTPLPSIRSGTANGQVIRHPRAWI